MRNIYILTGSIGCGKSTALKFFAELGYATIKADDLAKELLFLNPEKKLIKELKKINAQIIDENNEIKKDIFSFTLFNDFVFKQQAEYIIHAYVKELLQKKILKTTKDLPIIYEHPLFFEKKTDNVLLENKIKFKKIICIYSDIHQAQKRTEICRGLSKKEFFLRLQHQLPSRTKAKLSDYTIINNTDLKSLASQVKIISDCILLD